MSSKGGQTSQVLRRIALHGVQLCFYSFNMNISFWFAAFATGFKSTSMILKTYSSYLNWFCLQKYLYWNKTLKCLLSGHSKFPHFLQWMEMRFRCAMSKMPVPSYTTSISYIVLCLFLFSSVCFRYRRSYGHHICSRGDGSLQEQAQTTTGSPQPGGASAHITTNSHTNAFELWR